MAHCEDKTLRNVFGSIDSLQADGDCEESFLNNENMIALKNKNTRTTLRGDKKTSSSVEKNTTKNNPKKP